jgi:FMN-dependent NADH-azoreductase
MPAFARRADMRGLLYVRGSIFGDDGQSSRLAEAFIARFVATHPDAKLVRRDVQNPLLPHLDAATFYAFGKPADALGDTDRARLRLSDQLIGELEAATDLLIGLPLYNFGVPSAFKAWIDHVTRANRTFRATAKGPQGLLDNIRHCWVIAARGGQYQGTPRENQVPYLTTMLGFLGIAAPQFVFAEAMLRSDLRDDSLARARREIDLLALD